MRYCIWYAICDLFNKRILTVVTIAMFVVSFAVAEKSGLFYLTYNYNKLQAKDVVTTSFEKTYKINISKYSTGFCSENDRDNIISFMNEIDKLECVSFSGMYYERTEEIQNPILYANRKMLTMCGILDEESSDFVCLAGKNTGYKQGDIFMPYEGHPEYSFAVTGMTKENKKFIASYYFDTSGQMLELDDYMIVSLENVLEIDPWYIVNGLKNIYLGAKEGYSSEYIVCEIEKIAQKCNIDLYGVKSLNESFKEFANYAMENAGVNYMIPLALIICSVITMIVGSVYSVRLNKKDYGIMLANGMTHVDINRISTLAVEIKIIISFVIASTYICWNAGITDEDGNGTLMFKILLPVYILFLLIISVIVNGITVAIVNKDNTKNKIEENA